MTTRFMCSLVIMHAVQHDILPKLGAAAPEMLWDPTAKLVKRVEAGERADGIVATNEALAELIGQGFIDEASIVPVAEGAFGTDGARWDGGVSQPSTSEPFLYRSWQHQARQPA